MSRRASLADYGLIGLVGGGIATLLAGILTLGTSAFLGRIPVALVLLLSLTATVTAASLVVILVAKNRHD